MGILYSPELSIEEIARKSGVKAPTVRKYIRENFIDREYDSQLIRFRRVQQFFKENPDATSTSASIALGEGYSRNTVEKFRDPANAPVPNKNKIFLSFRDPTTSKAAIASVSDEDRIILGIILRLYLKDDRFDCDLTFSKGDFYKYGVQYPRYCFDLYPESTQSLFDAPEVLALEKGESTLADNSLSSVIIDLPQEISEDGVGSPCVFSDIKDLALSYYRMLSLAYKKLRYHSDTQTGGLLIVKTGDIRWHGEIIWLSKIVTELATGRLTRLSSPVYDELRKEAERRGSTVEKEFPLFDMELTDKFIHTYGSDSIGESENGDHSVKAHDYFLVFRKGREDIDYDTFYYGSDIEFADNNLPVASASESVYGPKVVSRKSRVEDKHIYEVRLPQKNKSNHIDIQCIVSDEIRKKVSDVLEIGIPFSAYRNGEQFLHYLKNIMYERLTVMSNPEVDKRVPPTMKEREMAVAKCLRDYGVHFIQWPQGEKRRPKDCYRTILCSDIMKVQKVEDNVDANGRV